jgi:hypothetical protein
MRISVQRTCDLAPGETCVPESYRWARGELSRTYILHQSERIDEIEGGETVEVELSTSFIFDDTSL